MMKIALLQEDFFELLEEVRQNGENSHNADDSDTLLAYPRQLGKGYIREIELRAGLDLSIRNYELYNDLVIEAPLREHPVEISCHLSGSLSSELGSVSGGQSCLFGSGIAPKDASVHSAGQKNLRVDVHIEPDLLKTFVAGYSAPMPPVLNQLVRDYEQPQIQIPAIKMSPAMQVVLQQILHCPYQGFTKKMYLESKVWELIALQLDLIAEEQQQSHHWKIKSDDIDCIHYAREILLRDSNAPPSLENLARQVGLNECTLKRGFRQVFGTTVFGYLHHHRLEQARHLLEEGEMNVAEVARKVGFADRSYFAAAFCKKFGLNPGLYRKAWKSRLRAG
jgi:AraC-like DNA-binding protein